MGTTRTFGNMLNDYIPKPKPSGNAYTRLRKQNK